MKGDPMPLAPPSSEAPKTLRDQLLANGFKESPVAMVDRLYNQMLEWEAKPAWTFKFQMRVLAETKELREKITKICEERKIGNPLKGQAIEYLEQ